MSEPAISVNGLGKLYRLGATHENTLSERLGNALGMLGKGKSRQTADIHDFWALRDVSFEVRQGETLGIIGGNGAGKSTLLKVLSRITQPTTGRAIVRGRLASLLEVGTGFHAELTGRENVFLNGTILGMRKFEVARKFDEIVAFAGLEKFIDTPVKRYSSGMYVRLAFAVAAHLEPDVLVIDEVLAVGDVEFQKRCLGKMDDVAREGRTVLFVSHNMAAVRKLCSRGLLMSEGQVRFEGDIGEAISAYLGAGTEELLHSEDLKLRPRPAWARVLIESSTLLDERGAPTKVCEQGADVRICMVFRDSPNQPIRWPVMGLVLKDALGEIVGGVNTRMTATAFRMGGAREAQFECVLKSPPLLPGDYSIDLWLGDGSQDVDTVEGAIRFAVVAKDVYESGVSAFSHMGTIYFQPEWALRLDIEEAAPSSPFVE